MKGGSVIGLVVAALQLLKSASGYLWLNWLSLIVFIFLVYGFTRRIANKSRAEDGFPYGRCMGFVVSMMLFTGVIVGFVTCLVNNFMIRDAVEEMVNASMVVVQDMLTTEQFDSMYDTMYSAMFNPLSLVLAGVVGYVVQGAIVGLFVCAQAQRKPDPFAGRNSGGNQ